MFYSCSLLASYKYIPVTDVCELVCHSRLLRSGPEMDRTDKRSKVVGSSKQYIIRVALVNLMLKDRCIKISSPAVE